MALDNDHEFEDALAALSVPNEAAPGGVSRRRFITGLGAAGLVGMLGRDLFTARPAGAADAGRRIVLMHLGGGSDGLGTLMPAAASVLDTLRPGLLPTPGTLLPLGDGWGLHPSLPWLHGRWNANQVAFVGGVGIHGAGMSHFETTRQWMNAGPGSTGGALAGTGWLGRWLDTFADEVPLRGVSLTGAVPLALIGATTAGVGIPAGQLMFAVNRNNQLLAPIYTLLETWGSGADPATATGFMATVAAQGVGISEQLAPVYTAASASPEPLVQQATRAAHILNRADLGCRAAFLSTSGFDLHASLKQQHAALLGQVDRAAAALFTTLQPAVAANTVLVVQTEFGRRIAANGSGGSDHGAGGYAIVVGPGVRRGVVGGHLDIAHPDARGNAPVTVSHVDLIGTVLSTWLGADATALLGAPTTTLPLFR